MKNYVRHISLWVGIVISGLFIYLAFRGSDFGEIASILGSSRYSWYIWSLVALALHVYLRSLRWQFILSSLKQITTISAFSNVMIGLEDFRMKKRVLITSGSGFSCPAGDKNVSLIVEIIHLNIGGRL